MWVIKRPAARVVLLDRHQRLFMMKSSDPIDPYKPSWWEIPGGGAEPGEDLEDAARRELYEETGFQAVTMGPCIWRQYVEYEFGGLRFESDEFTFLATTDTDSDTDSDLAWQPQKLEALEAAAFEGSRWWELDDLLECPDPVLPTRLREFLPDILAGNIPTTPLDIAVSD